MITTSALGKSFGAKTLFGDAAFELRPGSCYGLVGANGCGKTTLLRILAGREPPSEGTVVFPKGARVALLEQDRPLEMERPIVELAMRGDEAAHDALLEQRRLAEEHCPDPLRVAALDDALRRLDAYTLRGRAAAVLDGLGIPTHQQDRPLSTLSGGFQLRVRLAQLLVSQPDLLLLDEPTNHLDILSIRWLEKFLSTRAGVTVVVSHDRRFLDNVARYILDVDYGTVKTYTGTYTAFERQKVEEHARREQEQAHQHKQLEAQLAFVERFRYKATKARQAQSRLRQIERTERIEVVQTSRRAPHFRFQERHPSGRDVLVVRAVAKDYGDHPVLHDVTFSVRRGERVAIIGPNGIGKSTLLRIMAGRLAASSGSLAWGHKTDVGYFAQDHRELWDDADATVLGWLWAACSDQPESWVRGRLGLALFSGDDVHKRVSSLSGGEMSRLILARLALTAPNVMLLDEPTNHLDIQAIEALTQALVAFEGTLLFVSHDRWFVSNLATRIIELSPAGLRDYPGTYAEYLAHLGDDHLDAAFVAQAARAARDERRSQLTAEKHDLQLEREELKRKKNRLKALPGRRDACLVTIDELERGLSEHDHAYQELGYFERTTPEQRNQHMAARQELQARLEQAMTEWEALEREIAELTAEISRQDAVG